MYACIDLGSNSFHLLIAHWRNGRADIVERFSEKVQLGEGLRGGGEIRPEAFQRGLRCLRQFRRALDRHPVYQYWAVGTNALRTATNAAEFLAQAAAVGLEVSVISGLEEAVLVYTGVQSGLPETEQRRLVVDIGGGSTEVIIGCGQQRLFTQSLPLGCVSWRDAWFSKLSAADSEATILSALEGAADEAAECFALALPGMRDCGWEQVFASSGTAKMLAGVCEAQHVEKGLVNLQALEALQGPLLRSVREPHYRVPGLKPGRRDLLLPGWAVMTGLMRQCGIRQLSFSPNAMREGMLSYLVNHADTAGKMLASSADQTLSCEPPLHASKAH